MANQSQEKIGVVLNKGYGGFSLSYKGITMYNSLTDKNLKYYECGSIERHDPSLVQVIKTLGIESFGNSAKLEIEYISSEMKDFYHIDEYEGFETLILLNELHMISKIREIKKSTNLSIKEKLRLIFEIVE
jgi:hypothetical protein